MKIHRSRPSFLAVCAALVSMAAISSLASALTFDTIVFSDDFEGFPVGETLNGDTPSGTGLLWQYIGTAGHDVEVSNSQSFGAGTNSMDMVRVSPSVTPRYFTYPNVVPEANVTANSQFGVQFDLYVAEAEFDPITNPPTLSGVSVSLAPGGVPVNAGAILSYGDGEVRIWDSGLGTYALTGQDFGIGWQTVEMVHAIGPDTGGSAQDVISFYLTRHSGNSAGPLSRTLIHQSTETLVLGNNFRADINNNGAGRYYLDNIVLGTLVPEPGSFALAGLGIAAMALRRRAGGGPANDSRSLK